jgi:hypothetical protein
MRPTCALATTRAQSVHVVMKHEAPSKPELRPGTRVYHGPREATVLSVDADPTAHVWIVYADNPDEDAMVHRADLFAPCSVCEKAPGTIEAIDCDVAAFVCRECFEYYADGGALMRADLRAMRDLSTLTTDQLLIDVAWLQEVQRHNPPTSELWQRASVELAPLFAELAARQRDATEKQAPLRDSE